MEQSWKGWASMGVPLHPHFAGGWSPRCPLSLCLLSYRCSPQVFIIWKGLGQWEEESLGGRSALGSGHSPYLSGWEFWAQTNYWFICLGLSLSHVHSLSPSVTLHLLMFASKISYSCVWILLIPLCLGLTKRCGCSASPALCTPFSPT